MNGRTSRQITMKSTKNHWQSGVTLIELLVVLAVGMVLMAMAIPMVQTTMDGVRLHGSMGSAANLTQRVRTEAIKQNLSQGLFVRTVGKQVVLFVEPYNAAPVAPLKTDQQYWLPDEFSVTPGTAPQGIPPLTGLSMWGSAVAPKVNQDAFFNSRGLPCTPNPVVCSGTAGFVYYFKYQNSGQTRWAASSISPAGRIENWFWNGNRWGN